MNDVISAKGTIKVIITHLDGKTEEINFNNQILTLGKQAMTSSLANNIGGFFNFYINRMIFGNSGTVGGVPRVVDASRTGLFGPTLISKSIVSSVDATTGTNLTLTAVIAFSELVGSVINEMAILTADGNAFSMATFGDLTKSSTTQLTFNWQLSFI